MATTTTTGTTSTSTDLPADLPQQIGVLAPVRVASLALAVKLDAAKLRTLKLRHARLVARYGAGSPEVVRVEQAFAARVAAVGALAQDAASARTPPVPAAANTLTVHGRVVGASGAGLAGATVTVVDPSGKTLATVKADSTGYYRLDITPTATPAASLTLRTTPATGKSVDYARAIAATPGRVEVIDLAVG